MSSARAGGVGSIAVVQNNNNNNNTVSLNNNNNNSTGLAAFASRLDQFTPAMLADSLGINRAGNVVIPPLPRAASNGPPSAKPLE